MDDFSNPDQLKHLEHLGRLDSIFDKLDYLKSVTESYETLEATPESKTLTLFYLVKEYQDHHFDVNNREFKYWFLQYNGKRWYDTEMEHGAVILKLNSPARARNIASVLKNIEKEISTARKLENKGVIKPFEPYKSKKGVLYVGDVDNFTDPLHEKVSIPIFGKINISYVEIIRILEGYYEHNPTEHPHTTLGSPEVKAYSRYVLVKKYFSELLNKIESKDEQEHDEIGTLENQYPNIFSGNAFHIWSQMFKDFNIKETSRTDLRFMINIMQEKGLMHSGLSHRAILDWVNAIYEMTFERLPARDFSTDTVRHAIFEKATQ